MNKFTNVFISDIHLGSKKTEINSFLDFLKNNEIENLWIIGDFLDIERMERSGFLTKEIAQQHVKAIQKLLKYARKGTRIHYVWGNHDSFMKYFDGVDIGNIIIGEKFDFSVDGKKYLIIHGHQFDFVTTHHRLISIFGDDFYELFISINRWYNWLRQLVGLEYFSLSHYAKVKVKKAISFIDNFERAAIRYARNNGYDGIICGHIHQASIKNIDGIIYINTGCWTDKNTCNFVVEENNTLLLRKY